MKYNLMKKLMATIRNTAHFPACLLAASLVFNVSVVSAENSVSEPKIRLLSNPSKNYSVHIGDQLNRKIVFDVPAPYQLVSTALPKKGTKDKGIELVAIRIETEQQKTSTTYTVDLSYQPFINANSPTVMQLPAEKFTFTGAEKSMAIALPAWGFWFSPLVTGGIETAIKSMQPEFRPPLVDISTHQTRLTIFAGMLIISLLTLLYMNADGQWLPFMGGAFAKAHRQLKRLSRTSAVKTTEDEKQALVYIHQAFNQHYGANIFARDIERFITLRPSFRKMKNDIEQFFNDSNQSLYAVETRDSAKIITNLVLLSKQLRDCERGI